MDLTLKSAFDALVRLWKPQEMFKKIRATVSKRSAAFHRTAPAWMALITLALSTAARAQVAGDPEGSGVLVAAFNWMQGTLLGTVATVIAVIAVAAVGFGMLTGRVNWRHGAVVILGCFILFGATSIVAGIRTAASGY